MTSPTSAARCTDSVTRRAPYTAVGRARGGFTLIELLVVIGIIVILMSILIPTVLRSQRQGAKAREAMDFQTIATGLTAYNQDFGSYPPVDLAAAGNPTPVTGAEVLVMALAAPAPATAATPGAPADGADGPGFRIRAGTAVKGPYLPVDRFKIKYANATGTADDPARDRAIGLTDLWGERVILYYPATPAKLNVNVTNGTTPRPYVDALSAGGNRTTTQFNFNDNATVPDAATLTIEKFRAMLGDTNNDGWINTAAGEHALAADKPYILWSAGPDRLFGPKSTTQDDLEACDDVTNLK